jgi:hypothetical protein
MQTLSTGFLAFTLCVLAPTLAIGQTQVPPPRGSETVQPLRAHELAHLLQPHLTPTLEVDKEVAGLPPSSHPEVLTWERVYSLTLVCYRGGPQPRVDTLDPKALAEEATRNGFADFPRFRKEFQAAGRLGRDGFHEPSGDLLALLGRLKKIDHARWNVTFYENLFRLMSELMKGESVGLSQLNLDQVDTLVNQARQALSLEIAEFRDHFERFKVALGLSPRAPVVLDRESVARFGRVFDQVQSWHEQPRRNLADLPRIIKGLPAVGDVVIEGGSILGPMGGNPEQREDVLTRATRRAIQHQTDLDQGKTLPDAVAAEIELSVRSRVRRLFELRRSYEGEQRRYELAVRLLDQSLEQVEAPSPGGALARSAMVATAITRLLTPEKDRLGAEDRLVTVWTDFQTERLSLYQQLGILPYDDWASFFNDLSAR